MTQVSVIIPVFDAARTLARALDSVLAQEHRPLEIVIVDDGSSDASPAIAADYAQRHPDLVRVLRQDNAGPARARNRGIAEATGDLLAFNDADDVWLPGKLAAQVAIMAAEPDVDYTICAFKNVADDGFELAAWAVRKEGPDALPGFVFQAMLARRRAFDRIGVLDEAMRWAEDTDWFLRAHDLGLRLHKVDDIMVLRHIHDRNLSGRVADSQRMLVRAVYMSHQRRKKRLAEGGPSGGGAGS